MTLFQSLAFSISRGSFACFLACCAAQGHQPCFFWLVGMLDVVSEDHIYIYIYTYIPDICVKKMLKSTDILWHNIQVNFNEAKGFKY